MNVSQMVLLRACFRCWRSITAEEQVLHAKLVRAVKIMQATFLWRCLQAWAVAACEHQQKGLR